MRLQQALDRPVPVRLKPGCHAPFRLARLCARSPVKPGGTLLLGLLHTGTRQAGCVVVEHKGCMHVVAEHRMQQKCKRPMTGRGVLRGTTEMHDR